MTDLRVRKMRFAFADYPVPFLWNESNPAFSAGTNGLSFLAIAFEKMITAMIHEAMPLITDPEVAEEAEAFVRQEGQHCNAHRQHAKGLIKSYPGLEETFDAVTAMFDELTATKSLKYRLAYTADLEATFTPSFKMLLDNADVLFSSGDDRVASLFLWHFVEEIEHRSSALIVYDALVDNPWYRARVAPSVFKHVGAAMMTAAEGFNKHVPLEERKVDAMSMFGGPGLKKTLQQKLPFFDVPDSEPFEHAYARVRRRDQWTAAYGVVRSQFPGRNPAREKLPALASEWVARYDSGYDVTQWYTAAGDQPV